MSKDKESFGEQYLYVESLLSGGKYHDATVEISTYHPPNTLTAADGRRIDKHTIGFKDREKLLVLCKTNASIIHFITGQQPGEKWIGSTIRLQARMVDAFGETVPAIRVIPPTGCKVRRNLLKRLGTKAEWVAPTNKETK